MSSRPERRGRLHLPAAALALQLALCAAPSMAVEGRAAIGAEAVEAAVSAIRADPELGGSEKSRTWRFKDNEKKDKPPSVDPWLLDLARWLADGGRLLVWLGGATALALLLVGARRWLAVRGDAVSASHRRLLPSHVRQLDIRPESLPDDIGAAVRARWLAGERLAALSLLYRGALSRLVHSLAVPIGDASTEGDCVRLASARLDGERMAFVRRLVAAWQVAVYGDRPVETAAVLALCDDFDRMLPGSVAVGAAP